MRLVLDSPWGRESQSAAIESVVRKVGCSIEAPRKQARQVERDAGERA